MAFDPFITGAFIDAEDIHAENAELRKHINTEIAAADIAAESITTTEIVRGEYYQVTRDHQFTTGDVYTQYKGKTQKSKSYFTGQTKGTYDLSGTEQWTPVANTGKRIYLEAAATVFYHVACEISTPPTQLNGNPVGDWTGVAISVDGLYISATYGHSFKETGSSEYTTTIVTGCSNSRAQRRWYPAIYCGDLSAGWHELTVVTDCDLSYGFVQARSCYIEVFYKA